MPGRTPRQRNFHSAAEGGYVLVWFVISVILLVLLAAFVVDVGGWYVARTRAQKAADAAALAAAPLASNPTEACKVAAEEAARNGFTDLKKTYDPTMSGLYDGIVTTTTTTPTGTVSANCGAADTPVEINGNQVRVTVASTVSSIFAQVAGILKTDISRSSAAEYNPALEMGSPSNVLGNEPTFTDNIAWGENGRNKGYFQTGFRPGGGPSYPSQEWRPEGDAGARYWLNVTGPETPQDQGDPCTAPDAPYTSAQCGASTPPQDRPFGNQYQFVVRVTNPGPTDRLVIQAFDPNLWNVGQQCERRVLYSGSTPIARLGQVSDTPARIGFPLGYLGNYDVYNGNDWGRYLDGPSPTAQNKWCTGDSMLKTECLTTSGPTTGGPPVFFGTSARSKAVATPVVARGGTLCSLPDTTFEIYRQDATPSTLADNQLVASSNGGDCTNNGNGYISGTNPRTYVAQSGAGGQTGDGYYGVNFQKSWGTPLAANGSASTVGWWSNTFGIQNGVQDSNWTDIVRNWNTICTVSNPGSSVNGEYIVRVRTNGTVTANPSGGQTGNSPRSFGIGANRFSLRAALVSGTGIASPFLQTATLREAGTPGCTSCTGYTQVFSRGYLPLYVNISNGTFYLARVTPAYVNKTIRLQFFDPGESELGGKMTILAPPDAKAGGPAGSPINFTSGNCSYDSGANPGTLALAPTGPNCDIQIPQVTSTSTGWNGRWVTVDVKIPSDYWCDASASNPANRFNCWVRVNFNMGGQFIQDTTVWNAKVVGDPVRLVE
ncbi:MAG: pilus assembly protein TadG-related protein [Acidimicrobiia bacterium]